jgi:uncharacterized membrane protein
MNSFPIPAPAFNGNSRSVPAGSAFDWFRQGWAVFMSNPAQWIAMTLVFGVIVIGLHVVPLVGTLAANLLLPVLAAGLLQACQRVSREEPFGLNDLFSGLGVNATALVLLGVLYMAAMLVIALIVGVLGGGSILGGLMLGRPAGVGLALGGILLSFLLSLLLGIPVLMALFFAPALVLFNGMAPVASLKASFGACLKNLLPFLIYGLITMVLTFFALLPAGLGLLVLVPVMAGTLYAAYRDIFVAS